MAARRAGDGNRAMAQARRRRLARRAALVSLLILAATLGAIAALALDRSLNDDGPSRATEIETPTPPPATPAPIQSPAPMAPTPTPPPTPQARYLGALPPGLEGARLAEASDAPDLAFLPEGVEVYRIVRRWYAPVAAIGAGVDSLTRTQLDDLARGAIRDWSEVGGIAGEVRAFAIAEEDGDAAMAAFAPQAPARTFATYAELLEAMTLDSGAWAFVPVEEVIPTVTAIAVNGVDPVRGKGDARAWPYVDGTRIVAFIPRGRRTAAAHSAPLPEPITVIATGDILQSRCSLTQIQATGDWGSALRGPVAEYLAAADLTIGSLDGSIQDIAAPLGCFPHVNLSSPPQVIEALTLAGFDEVTVATNHVFDCGAEPCGAAAFRRTIALLRAAGIAVVGGGENLEEALAPAIFTVGETTFGVLGFDDVAAFFLAAGEDSPGTAPLDDDYAEENASGDPPYFRPASELGLERFRARIRALAEEVDVVIVQVQSGTEDTHDPSPRSVKALRAAVEAGATLVVGNHPHHAQAIEPRAEAFIAYALGNFIYDQTRLEAHTQGYLLEATFRGARLVNLRLVPYVIEDMYRPVFAEGATRTKILNDVFQASRRLAAPQE